MIILKDTPQFCLPLFVTPDELINMRVGGAPNMSEDNNNEKLTNQFSFISTMENTKSECEPPPHLEYHLKTALRVVMGLILATSLEEQDFVLAWVTRQISEVMVYNC